MIPKLYAQGAAANSQGHCGIFYYLINGTAIEFLEAHWGAAVHNLETTRDFMNQENFRNLWSKWNYRICSVFVLKKICRTV